MTAWHGDYARLFTEPAPCDDCPQVARCAALEQACVGFRTYVNGSDEVVWRHNRERGISKATFREVFGLGA